MKVIVREREYHEHMRQFGRKSSHVSKMSVYASEEKAENLVINYPVHCSLFIPGTSGTPTRPAEDVGRVIR